MLHQIFFDFYEDETAAASMEYILFLSFVGLVVIPSIIEYRDWVIGRFDNVTDALIKLRKTDF